MPYSVFLEDRNRNFFSVCEKIRKENADELISASEIACKAIYMPANHFYISVNNCLDVINNGYKVKGEVRNLLYKEIKKRYEQIKSEKNNLNKTEIARIIIYQPAPRFYLTEKSAITLYYKLLEKLPK